MKKINWRLANRPTPDEVKSLHEAGLLTKDEAREILFNEVEETARDTKSLESEIKFLRELVDKLSKNQTQTIITTIREVQRPYIQYPWYQPYQIWCGGTTGGNIALCSAGNSLTANAQNCATAGTSNFSAIKTF